MASKGVELTVFKYKDTVFFTVPQAAAKLGISPDALYARIHAGKVAVTKDKPWMIPEAELDRMMDAQPLTQTEPAVGKAAERKKQAARKIRSRR